MSELRHAHAKRAKKVFDAINADGPISVTTASNYLDVCHETARRTVKRLLEVGYLVPAGTCSGSKVYDIADGIGYEDLGKIVSMQDYRVRQIIAAIDKQPWADSEEVAKSIGMTRNTLTGYLNRGDLQFKDLKRARILEICAALSTNAPKAQKTNPPKDT